MLSLTFRKKCPETQGSLRELSLACSYGLSPGRGVWRGVRGSAQARRASAPLDLRVLARAGRREAPGDEHRAGRQAGEMPALAAAVCAAQGEVTRALRCGDGTRARRGAGPTPHRRRPLEVTRLLQSRQAPPGASGVMLSLGHAALAEGAILQ